MSNTKKTALADRKMVARAIKDSFVKLDPRIQVKNPVMLLVYIAAILTTVLWAIALFGIRDVMAGYTLAIAIILWFTVLFANFAEAIAEGRGKAQADALRAARKDVEAHVIPSVEEKERVTLVPSASLQKGDIIIVQAGEQIPADGEVIEGAASVDESAITGESAPVIRESGGDRSAVTGGTTVISDYLVIRVTSQEGESFLDQMIAMVEGASRKKTPNELALQILLVALSLSLIHISAEEAYCRVLEAARVLGAGCYVMHGIVKARRGSRINYEAAGKRLGDLGRMAADHGVLLALENVHWCMLSDPCALEALDPYVDGVTLGYTLDVKQAVQSGYTPWTYLERMGKKLRHVHICGTRVRNDGSIATCMPEEQPGLMEELLSRLCAQEYDGDVVLEVYNQDYGDYNDLARSCRTLAAMVERNK